MKNPIKQQFTDEERVRRAFNRLATILAEQWEEGKEGSEWGHTRIFETIIPEDFVRAGDSQDGIDHREHAVPCAVLLVESYNMFNAGQTVADVSEFLRQNLKIYRISKREQEKLDSKSGLNLKQTMPDGWKRGDMIPLQD